MSVTHAGRAAGLLLGAAALVTPGAAVASTPAAPPDTAPSAAAAVDTVGRQGPVRALVEQIAGATIYLRVGTDEGVSAGDTLPVARDSSGAVLGRVAVIAATAQRSVVTFAGAAFPVTRGQTLYLRTGGALGGAGARVAATGAPGASPSGVARTEGAIGGLGGAAGPGMGSRAIAGAGPTLSGRVSFDLDLRRSVTTYGGGDPVSTTRTFATPSVWLQTTARDLPGGFRFDADAQVAQRIADPSIVSPRTSPEIYEASLFKSFGAVPLDFRLGRFYSPYDPFGGYWDGLMVHYGSTVGGGVAAGFEPDRANQTPQGELPKAAAFLDVRAGSSGNLGYDGTLSLTAVRPTAASGLADHTFASFSQSVRAGRWFVTQDAQVDRGPSGTSWSLTRARLGVSGPLTDILSVRAGVSRYRPYLYWLADSIPLSYRRDEARGGFTLRLQDVTWGGDAAIDHDRGLGTGHTYSTFFGLRHVLPLRLGLDASGSWFTSGQVRVQTASVHFSRLLGATSARLGYDMYRSDAGHGRWLMSHAVDLGLDVPLGRGLHYSVLGQFRIGGGLGETRLFTSLSKSFGP